MTTLCFDCETSTFAKGNPYSRKAKLISYSVKVDDGETSFNYVGSLDFLQELRAEMQHANLLIGFNIKFDLAHVGNHGVKPPDRCRVWDCQIAEFILSGQKGAYPSLDGSLAKYGLGAKDDKIKEYWDAGIDTEFIPQEELEFYNNLDVDLTYKLYLKQQEIMTDKQKRLCLIMGLDLLVLQEMEFNGVKFDTALCKEKAVDAEQQLRQVTEELLKYSPSPRINLDSGQHLSCLLYGGKFDIDTVSYETRFYKSNSKATGAKKGDPYQGTVHTIEVFTCPQLFVPLPKTETKLKKKLALPDGTIEEIVIYETNEDVLKQLKTKDKWRKRVIELLLQRAEVAKLLDTYYGKLPELLEKMEWGEYLHGQYNQCTAATGRLSSSAPNMQNFSGDVDRLLVSRYAN